MAYDVTEERLKVRGSEQITRDLKVGRDLFINGTASINNNGVLTTADKGVANGVASLDATGRVPYGQLPESAMEYKGTWDASTNTPSLSDGIGTNGDFYVVSAAGTVTFSAGRSITFYVNDRVIYDGTLNEWERLPAGEVRSVNGQTGDVTLSIPTVVDTVAAGNMNAVTSNAVKTAIDNEATNRNTAISSAIATEVTNRNTAITNAVNALDVTSAGGDGKYISAISETNGKISATATTMDTAPTASSTKAVTSGGIKTAINTAETNAKNLANATGTLAIAHGGTGQTTQANVNKAIIGDMSTGSSDVTDGTEFVSSYASDNGFADTNAVNQPYKRQFVHVWNYIKGKISSVLGLTATAYGGKAATATTATTATTAYKIRTSAPSSPTIGDIWIS